MIAITHPLFGVEEETAILKVLASGNVDQGRYVSAFEKQFAEMCQVQEAIAVSSGTAALHLALLAYNVGPGDEVITTSFAFAAIANVILLTGAVPVFVDIDPDTYTFDPTLVEMALTRRTKAILAVHLYGHPCDMEQLEQFANEHSLVIVEDASQAHAAEIHGRRVGSYGIGCFSFHETKNMNVGEGGMVTTNNSSIADHIRLLRNNGQQVPYYHISIGYDLRMTEIQGALGLAQLTKLASFTEQRIANAAFLTEHLKEVVQTPVVRTGYRHVFQRYTIRVPDNRDKWERHLAVQGIDTATQYSLPIYRQPYYERSRLLFRISDPHRKAKGKRQSPSISLPVTEVAAKQVLSLPIHPALSQNELLVIVKAVLAFHE
jgi:perosamine synthetase